MAGGMNNSSLGGGFLPDMESAFRRHQQQNQMGHPSVASQHHMKNMMSGFENENPFRVMDADAARGGTNASLNFAKGKAVAGTVPTNNPNNSDDMTEYDEPSPDAEDGNGDNYEGGRGRRGPPWQRMKWTDAAVRLLISVVACVGEDGAVDMIDGSGHKRKFEVLQKKGKWKTISNIMMTKGSHVSPQQCEDKFNDLNKRYKKLNDLLGRGISCRVVENPALIDSITRLSAKTKDEVRRILNSKHLFYKEMCAYHNGQRVPTSHDVDLQGYYHSQQPNNGMEKGAGDYDDSEDDELENEGYTNAHAGERERMEDFSHRKKLNDGNGRGYPQSAGMEKLDAEMTKIFQDPMKSAWERRDWVKARMLQLQQQGFNCQVQALELEKQRFKWLRYCTKKNRELERLKLENERTRLENERKILELKQRELDFDLRRPQL